MSPTHLTELSEAQRQAALERFKLLRPFLEEEVPLTKIAQEHQIPLRTLRDWVSKYRDRGLTGLIRQPRSDQSKYKMPEKLVHLIEGLALQRPSPSIASIHRQVKAVAREQRWEIPSYDSVRDIIQQLDPGLMVLAQEGNKGYQEAFDLLYRRRATTPNAIWQADHALQKIVLLDEHDELKQPWLTVIIDDYSRAIAGYFLSFEQPTSLNTALALRQAIWRKSDPRWQVCGIPEILYSDHGSDFTSKHLEQVSADLKIRLMFSLPGQPRGRGRIERFFRTVWQLLLCELPGYAPKFGKPITPPVLSLAEFETRLHEFIVTNYHQRIHSTTKQRPQQMWETGGFVPHMPESLQQLDLLLLTVAKSRRVRQEGIQFQNYLYFDLTLAAYIGEDVTIRYDPRDIAEIYVYHQDQFICRAICQELAGETVSLREVIQHRNARRRELRGVLKDRSEVIDTYLKVHQPLPEPTAVEPDDEKPTTPKLKRYYNE